MFFLQAFSINYFETTSAPATPDSCVKKHKTNADYIDECTREARVDKKYINKMKTGHWWNLPKVTTSLKYWAFCYLKKLQIMSEAGVLRQDVVLTNMKDTERDMVVKIIDKCLFKMAHLPIETAWHYLYCFHVKDEKLSRRIHGI
ncbi:uncharacterized protein LOC119829138 [Zerene cesonia]|uniref:uncharacterized protein LOC119829138 n=1 Tax=Zerene cesonia TaxID=33412 RepID=UPI0018E57F11|nr:uncharacterized protein LOC119829138 [Zerene cesonia]